MYKLRDYQQQASDRAVAHMQSSSRENGILILPTGAGKSLVIADIAYRLGAPTLVFQPSKEILEQNYNKMLSYNISGVGVYSASLNSKEVSPITFATIGSVMRRIDQFRRFRYVIIDECHFVNSEAGMYNSFIRTTGCKVLGLTATPYRLYHHRAYGTMLRFITRMRDGIFTRVLYYVQVSDLMRRGYLAKMQYYSLPVVDTSKLVVNSTGMDYTDASVKKLYAKISYTEQLADVVRRLLAAGRKSILVFTRFTEEASLLKKMLGNAAAVVTGSTPAIERDEVIKAFKAGVIQVVANVGVLTTGFDYPELATVVVARPTRSLSLWYQMVGRAIRPAEGKQAWVVDLCGTYHRYGKVEDLTINVTRGGQFGVFSHSKQLTNVYFK